MPKFVASLEEEEDDDAAGFPSQLEHVGLDRGDGKGYHSFSFRSGKTPIWDVTCTFTFSPCNIVSSAINPGSATTLAEKTKVS